VKDRDSMLGVKKNPRSQHQRKGKGAIFEKGKGKGVGKILLPGESEIAVSISFEGKKRQSRAEYGLELFFKKHSKRIEK